MNALQSLFDYEYYHEYKQKQHSLDMMIRLSYIFLAKQEISEAYTNVQTYRRKRT